MQSIFTNFEQLNGTTWFYFSLLLMVTVFFRFSRFFSIRNWDVITLFLFVPGLLATTQFDRDVLQLRAEGAKVTEAESLDENLLYLGFTSLFAVTGYFLLRCCADLFLTRRPRIDPNLNIAGLAFLCITLYGFMMHLVFTKPPDPGGRASAQTAMKWLKRDFDAKEGDNASHLVAVGVTVLPAAVSSQVALQIHHSEDADGNDAELAHGVARGMVSLSHLATLIALVLIGWQHFGSPLIGMSMATLYLLLPLTAINVERLDHMLPSVFIVWAVYAFRWPVISGSILGLASVFVYPLFLIPLWAGFYWERGARRFLVSFGIVTACLWLFVDLLDPVRSFMHLWSPSVAWKAWDFSQDPTALGFWTPATQFYRLPIFVTFMACTLATAFVPKQKNLADLIALSAAVILFIQFWYADRGGTYIHWYLPLLLLVIFRPNLSGVRPPELPVKVQVA